MNFAIASSGGRSARTRLILANLLLAGVALSVVASPVPGYRTSFVDYLMPIQWLGLAATLGLLVSLCRSDVPLVGVVFTSCLTSVTLLFLPSLVTGALYGPDSYNKAARAGQVAAAGSSSNVFYPAMSVFSAMADAVVAPPAIWVPMVTAAGVTGPLAGLVFARIFFGRHDGLQVRYLAVASILLPLGFGIWLTTRSIYHSFFLSLPLVVLLLGVFYSLAHRHARSKARRVTLLGLVLGIGVSLYHPFAAILLVGFVAVNAFSLLRPTGRIDPAPRGSDTDRGIANIVFAIGVFVMFVQLLTFLTTGITGVLASLGAISMGVTDVSGQLTCVPNATSSVPFCSEFPELVTLGLAYLIFGLTTGLVGRYDAVAVRRYLKEGSRPPEFPAVNGLYAFFAAVLGFKILPVFQIPLKTRALAVGTFLGVVLLVWLALREWKLRPNRTVTAVFVLGCVGYALLPSVAGATLDRTISPGFHAKFGVVAGLAVVGYLAVGRQSPVARRALLLAPLVTATVFFPLLYPVPAINGVPNYTWTEPVHSQTTWIERHHGPDPTYAAGSRQYSLHRYLFPTRSNDHYEGSVYLLSTLTVPPGAETIRSYPSQQGQRIPPAQMNYVLLSGVSSDYVYTTYRSGSEFYIHAGGVRSTNVERRYRTSERVYDAAEHTAVYTVSPASNDDKDGTAEVVRG